MQNETVMIAVVLTMIIGGCIFCMVLKKKRKNHAKNTDAALTLVLDDVDEDDELYDIEKDPYESIEYARASIEEPFGYSLHSFETRYTFGSKEKTYEHEYLIELDTFFSIRYFRDIGEVEAAIRRDLVGGLLHSLGIKGYIEDYDESRRYLEKHPDSIIASSLNVYYDKWHDCWRASFYVNKPVSVPSSLIGKDKDDEFEVLKEKVTQAIG